MQIREALPNDLPNILATLRASLGEESSKKNEEVWNYKHILNPFGPSCVWVAEVDNRIAGVRAFMKWNWQKGEKVYVAYRAVDTATHPDFQGQGIFKKLTLYAIQALKDKEECFIFNTPNDQSRPGYLKMGWQEVDRITVRLKPIMPFPMLFASKLLNKSKLSSKSVSNHMDINKISNKFFTPKSYEYLTWRYKNNPIQEYKVLEGDDFFIAMYVKQRKRIKELRISEFIINDRDEYIKKILRAIKSYAKKHHCLFISFSGDLNIPFSLKTNLGPLLLYNPISIDENTKMDLASMDMWQYSLGELELF